MKSILFIASAIISLSVIASYEAEIFIFDKTVVLPGDCKYLVERENYACRKGSDLVVVSFPSVETAIRKYQDVSSSAFEEAGQQLRSKFAEKMLSEQFDHFATAVETQGVSILQYSICNKKKCVSVLSGSPQHISNILNQIVSDLIIFPENLNDL